MTDHSDAEMRPDEFSLIKVFVAMRDGVPIHEELPARQLDEHTFELLASPGLALNLAKGDIVDITDPQAPATILKRGGNFCIQIYADEIPADALHGLENAITDTLHGSIDGMYKGNLAITVPAAAGLANISQVFDAFSDKTGLSWYFCNIYANPEDEDDETLLSWWL